MTPDQQLQAARDQWHWRGQARPDFAVVPQPGQVSVWDYPRPPRLVADTREVVIYWGAIEIARSSRCIAVQETAHPPSFYIPWADVNRQWLQPAQGTSMCEWKGPAHYWSLQAHGQLLPHVAWSYPHPLDEAKALADCVAFYPAQLQCTVAGAPVTAQPGGFYGGFYGGWVTPELVGPFKGVPGSTGW